MASSLPPPKELDLKAPDLATVWRRWRRTFENYLVALGVVGNSEKDEARKVAIFLHCGGEDVREVYAQATFSEEERDKSKVMKNVLAKFEVYCNPRKNSIYNRRQFFEARQNDDEQFDMFLLRVRRYADSCDFGNQSEQNIRDRILFGMQDTKLSERLMEKSDDELTLDNVIKWCRSAELSKVSRVLESTQIAETTAAQSSKPNQSQRFTKPKGKGDKCQKCGYARHYQGKTCPAKESTCHKCRKIGHFQRCCRSEAVQEVEEPEFDADELFFAAVEERKCSTSPWYVNLEINQRDVKFKIDSGADVTLMTIDTYQKLQPIPELTPTKAVLNSVSGTIECKGTFRTQTLVRGKLYKFKVYVANCTNNLLSRTLSEMMQLVKLNIHEVRRRNNKRSELGYMKGSSVKINLKSGVEPFKVTTARRIPIPLMDAVNEELERMQQVGVIEQVTEPTDWCSPLVVVPKETKQGRKKVRICVDLRGLNRAIKREHYTLPTVDDIVAKMAGGKMFSSLDAASGYYQMKLDEESQKLTTFIGPKGRYCFKRVPFGISSASEIFQSKINEFLEGIDGVIAYQDDVIVTGRSKSEHDQRLNTVLQRLKSNGVELNKEKCQFGVSKQFYA